MGVTFTYWHVRVSELSDWRWPYACHTQGHIVGETGDCRECGATAASFERADLWSATTAPVNR